MTPYDIKPVDPKDPRAERDRIVKKSSCRHLIFARLRFRRCIFSMADATRKRRSTSALFSGMSKKPAAAIEVSARDCA